MKKGFRIHPAQTGKDSHFHGLQEEMAESVCPKSGCPKKTNTDQLLFMYIYSICMIPIYIYIYIYSNLYIYIYYNYHNVDIGQDIGVCVCIYIYIYTYVFLPSLGRETRSTKSDAAPRLRATRIDFGIDHWDWNLPEIPSGNGWHSYWKWQFIVDFPIKNDDFPLLC